ncbi:hypothetical protein BSKO_00994 [Bryopsis sp. KO-2023]|nr:hypothetical protein BSKO_00994 [Bryopsis sp. KO-2023]
MSGFGVDQNQVLGLGNPLFYPAQSQHLGLVEASNVRNQVQGVSLQPSGPFRIAAPRMSGTVALQANGASESHVGGVLAGSGVQRVVPHNPLMSGVVDVALASVPQQNQLGRVQQSPVAQQFDMLNTSNPGVWAMGNSGSLSGVNLGTSSHSDGIPLTSAPSIAGVGQMPAQNVLVSDAEGLLRQAHEAYRIGNYQEALRLCQPAYTANPDRTDVLLLVGAVYYQLKNYEQCIAFNDRCILLDPTMAEAHANLANALQQMGNYDMAIIYYQSAIRLKPGFTDAYNNMASALVQKGLIPQAMECYMTALRLDPSLVDVHNNLGDLWKAQNQLGTAGRNHAQRCYQEALRIDRMYAPAWRGLGDLFREMNNHSQAVISYEQAIRIKPNYADAYTGMGVSLKELKRKEEAASCFETVVELRPGCALSLGNLAGMYYDQGKLPLAIQTYNQAIQLEPNFPEAFNNLGNALREAGRIDEAVQCYTTCIQLQYQRPQITGPWRANPQAAATQQAQRLAVAYNNLGGILKMQGRTAEAISCYEHIAMLQPESPEAHANLASAYKDVARHDVAVTSYKRALTLRVDFPEAFANLVHSLQCICDWQERDALFMRLEQEVRRDLAGGRLPPVQPFHAMAYPFEASLALEISKKYAEHCALTASRLGCPQLAHPPAKPLESGQRLRVAYVSSDFGNHPLSHLMASVFGLHNRSKVEVFCYALTASDGSEWRQKIENEAEHFLDVASWNAVDIAGKISADGIHIAINLNGYTKGARNEIFALHPAPVQASYMGFPATTGASFLPYLITDPIVAPKEHRHCYLESLALMPNCYFVNDYKRQHQDVIHEVNLPTRSDFNLPEDKIIYSCSNQLYKYDPETFDTWCNILHRVPNSVLWLLRFPPYGESKIRQRAVAHGIDSARIIFTDVVQKDLHIKRSGLADVFLDTPLCNAHTTGCDVLWGGCPMITLPLERMASRVAASLCFATGMGHEMVVSSHKEYEEKAVVLGLNHEKRHQLRVELKHRRHSCPLFDTDKWVGDLEKVFEKMWAFHCDGKGPRTFSV